MKKAITTGIMMSAPITKIVVSNTSPSNSMDLRTVSGMSIISNLFVFQNLNTVSYQMFA